MARHATLTVALALALALPGTALANHFIVELDGAFNTPVGLDADDVHTGNAFGGTFGVGGRIRGFAPAYYLVGRVGVSQYDFTGPAWSGSPQVQREQSEYAIGGRIYLPINRDVRLMLQVAFGETFDETCVQRTNHWDFMAEGDAFTVFTDAGLQYRFSDAFALGIGGGFAYYPDQSELDVAAVAAGMDEGAFGRARLGLTTTFHF